MGTDFIKNDGGRAAAGFKGSAGDCVARSIAIASCLPYREVYAALAEGTGTQRKSKRTARRAASARNGINTSRKWFKNYMTSLGFEWVPTMQVGQGCKVHLSADELPSGRIIVAVSGHYTAMIDGVIHDTHDPRRPIIETINGVQQPQRESRCVYGYWRLLTA